MASSGLDFANAAFGAAFGGFVNPIFDMVIENLMFVSRCHKECTALREELQKIKPLLEKVSDQNKGDPAMKSWLDGFEDCFKKAEEIVETCTSDGSKFWDRAREVWYGSEILKLKEKISRDVNLASLVLLTLQSGRRSQSSMGVCGAVQEVPGKILGMDGHLQRAKLLITAGRNSKESSCVGIRGMGGAGKTLLAQMVNNDKDIQKTFGKESIIWITVGRDAQIPVIYERMRKSLRVDNHGGSLEDQCTDLRNEFLRRSVLLVLDDIWDGIVHEYKEMVEWLNIARGPGSVTVVTTRDESIIRKCVNVGEEIILRLSEEQSWELFCSHAFGSDNIQVGKDLEGLAMDVCKECKCLPLALKVIGLTMKGKCDIGDWRRALRHLQSSSMIEKSVDEALFGRLQLSYEQLEVGAKICFMYFAAFPEDCEIPVEHL